MNTYFLDRARSLYTFILWAVGSAVPLSLLARYIDIEKPLREIVIFGPAIVGLLLAPIGLYFILKSYQKQEQNNKQKLVYFIGLLLINTLGIALIFNLLTRGITI